MRMARSWSPFESRPVSSVARCGALMQNTGFSGRIGRTQPSYCWNAS